LKYLPINGAKDKTQTQHREFSGIPNSCL